MSKKVYIIEILALEMLKFLANFRTLGELDNGDSYLASVMSERDGKIYDGRHEVIRDLNAVGESLHGRMVHSNYVCGPILGEGFNVNAIYSGQRGIVNLGRIVGLEKD